MRAEKIIPNPRRFFKQRRLKIQILQTQSIWSKPDQLPERGKANLDWMFASCGGVVEIEREKTLTS